MSKHTDGAREPHIRCPNCAYWKAMAPDGKRSWCRLIRGHVKHVNLRDRDPDEYCESGFRRARYQSELDLSPQARRRLVSLVKEELADLREQHAEALTEVASS